MKVCVFGGTGSTGQWVTKMLLEKKHEVTLYVRNSNKVAINNDLLKVVQGEINDSHHIAKVLKGQDAVISCLGSNTTKKATQLEDMAKSISKAMKEAGINRIFYMATAGIEDEFKGPIKAVIRLMLGNVIDDHKKAAEIYKSEGFLYTIIRPMQLKDGNPSGTYVESFSGLPISRKPISRSNVAMFIVKALEDEKYVNTSVGMAE